MSRLQAGISSASKQVTFVANTSALNQSQQTLEELLDITPMNDQANVAKGCIEKSATFTTNTIIWCLEQAHFLGRYTYYQNLLSAGLDINACLGSRGTSLTYAVFQKDTMLLSYLLRSGANPNSFTEISLRCTVLEIAVSMGSLDVVRLLCQGGAELNGKRSEVLQRAAQ